MCSWRCRGSVSKDICLLQCLQEGFCNNLQALDWPWWMLFEGKVCCTPLSAIGKDGNNQMLPIAFAIVEAETKERILNFSSI